MIKYFLRNAHNDKKRKKNASIKDHLTLNNTGDVLNMTLCVAPHLYWRRLLIQNMNMIVFFLNKLFFTAENKTNILNGGINLALFWSGHLQNFKSELSFYRPCWNKQVLQDLLRALLSQSKSSITKCSWFYSTLTSRCTAHRYNMQDCCRHTHQAAVIWCYHEQWRKLYRCRKIGAQFSLLFWGFCFTFSFLEFTALFDILDFLSPVTILKNKNHSVLQ